MNNNLYVCDFPIVTFSNSYNRDNWVFTRHSSFEVLFFCEKLLVKNQRLIT